MELNIKSIWSDDFLKRMSHDELPLDFEDRRYMKPVVSEEMGYVLWKTIFNSFIPHDQRTDYEVLCLIERYRLSADEKTLNVIEQARQNLMRKVEWPLDSTVYYGSSRHNIIQVRWETFLKYLFHFASDTDEFSYVVCPYSSTALLMTCSIAKFTRITI